ncbi:isopentenyl-diphosphate delta-isomerase [Yoonia sp. MH D7]
MTDTILIPTWVDGILTPVDKLHAHTHGLRHKAVSVFVINQGRILLQQRAAHKYHTPNLWANTCCTHPNWDEDPAECAVRRLQDELGITDLQCTHRGQLEYRADVGGGMYEHEVVDAYLAKAPDLLKIDPNPDEVQAVRWISPDALNVEIALSPEIFTPWLRIYMRDHADTILGSR